MTEPLTAEEVEAALFELRRCKLPSCPPCDQRVVRLVATYDRLTARAEAADAALMGHIDMIAELQAAYRHLEAAEADLARFRTALEKIARLVPITGVSPEGIARRALAPTTEEKP